MVCEAVILAAGLGTRMKSKIPKVLHTLGGKPLVSWSIGACQEATGRAPIVVIGEDKPEIRSVVGEQVDLVLQEERLGTGHALLQTKDRLKDHDGLVIAVYADLPLLRAETLKRLIAAQEMNEGPVTLLTAESPSSRGFGRIERDQTREILRIVEEAHATPEQLGIQELNVGAYCFRSNWLWEHLEKLPLSPKGEYYLTDLIGMAVENGKKIASASIDTPDEIIGINTREHLAQAEAALRARISRHWMLEGVTLIDPASTYIDPTVELGQDTVIMPNTTLEGGTVVGAGCRLGPNTIVRNSMIGDDCRIEASVVEGATLEDEVDIGPFSHLRKGTYLERGVHLGNFTEVKDSRLGRGVKMGHFSYVGDAEIGPEANIGAGTITVNYDGFQKHKTEIGEKAFIGSDTMLVAPVKIGQGARTGAGSVVTKDVPDNCLAVGIPARVIRKLEKGD